MAMVYNQQKHRWENVSDRYGSHNDAPPIEEAQAKQYPVKSNSSGLQPTKTYNRDLPKATQPSSNPAWEALLKQGHDLNEAYGASAGNVEAVRNVVAQGFSDMADAETDENTPALVTYHDVNAARAVAKKMPNDPEAARQHAEVERQFYSATNQLALQKAINAKGVVTAADVANAANQRGNPALAEQAFDIQEKYNSPENQYLLAAMGPPRSSVAPTGEAVYDPRTSSQRVADAITAGRIIPAGVPSPNNTVNRAIAEGRIENPAGSQSYSQPDAPSATTDRTRIFEAVGQYANALAPSTAPTVVQPSTPTDNLLAQEMERRRNLGYNY